MSDHQPHELELVTAISLPEHQGESLTSADYLALALVTIVVPALLILIGVLL